MNLSLALFGSLILGGIACNSNTIAPTCYAEEEVTTGYITFGSFEHGIITTDIENGNVGDLVTVEAKSDLFFCIEYVAVNGVNLIESETTVGKYMFALNPGENVITASFIIDKETVGELTTVFQEIENKDWESLFSVETVVALVKWVLDCGVLFALIRYFVKDKRLEKKLEEYVKENSEKYIPTQVKESTVEAVEEVITPVLTNFEGEIAELKNTMSILTRCYALAQQGDEKSKMEILETLQGLSVSDLKTINDVKAYIQNIIEKSERTYKETLEAINKLKQNSQNEISSEENEPEEEKDDGTIA